MCLKQCCSERCLSEMRLLWIFALCCFLLTDSLVTAPRDVTPPHTSRTDAAFWVGRLVFKKKTKKPKWDPGITVLLRSLPVTEEKLRVLVRCLCEAFLKAAGWSWRTWVRFVSCVPQGLAPTWVVQGANVMAEWKHRLPRCLHHSLPPRAPPRSVLLVKCHQKPWQKERSLPHPR